MDDLYALNLYHSLTAVFTTAVLLGFLLTLSVIDLRCFQLPDSLTLPLLWIGLLLNATLSPQRLPEAVYGAVIGYLSCLIVYKVMKKVTGKEGLGYGDFKLMAALGAWMGWQCLPTIATLASTAGIVTYGFRYLISKKSGELAFGPCLSASGAVVYISQQMNSLADFHCSIC